MASSGSLPVPSYLSNPHQIYPNEAEYNALKRSYLSLLPPAQIIDICLIFEAYVPIHVRGTIWPYDLKSSIANLLAKTSSSTTIASTSIHDDGQKSQQPTNNGSTDHNPPPMDSLKDPASIVSSTLVPTGTTHTPISVPESHAQLSPSEHARASTSSQIFPQSQLAPYYPYIPHAHQPAYPHAPYYPPPQHHPSPYYPQPPSYPPYSQISLTGAQSLLQQPNYTPPPFTRPPLTRPDGTAAEDLPSYEEMIVEALTEYTEPEGAAPKDLFAWMAARYPLQTNFRPSASQALQKAFKRGRLEKQSSGKYRLNMNWEGGTTSRRNTRRPQTQAAVLMQQTIPPPSAFAVGSRQTESNPLPSSQPIPPPCAYGYPGYPHQKPTTENTATASLHPTTSEHEDVGEGSDAWEAAQNILKAINFGNYLRHPNPLDTSKHLQTDSMPSNPLETRPATPTPIDPELTGNGESVGSTEAVLRRDRAGLQAELALLAAQLAGLSENDSENVSADTAISAMIEALRS